MTPPSSARPALGCLGCAGLAAVAITTLAVLQSLGIASPWEDEESGKAVDTAVSTPISLGAALVLLAVASAFAHSAARDARLRQRHPGQPWRWRRDWSEGRADPVGSGAWSMLVVATLWTGASAIAARAMWFDDATREPLLVRVIFGIGFPLIGVALFALGVARLVRDVRFGRRG